MRKEKGKLYLKGIILSILFGSLSLFNTESVFATPDPPPKPDRYTTITVEYITYEWWLMRWEDSELVCKIIIEHEDLPSLNEVYVDCGEDLYNAWIEQDACPFEIISQTPVNCPGYYLHFASSTPRERDLVLALPPPVVWINLKGCISEGGTNRCGLAPVLVLHGDEPLVEEELLRINGELDGVPFSCSSASCELPLSETDEDGVILIFWADSSYGDSSYLFNAHLRVIYVEAENNEKFWYVDILSERLKTTSRKCSILK